MLLRGGRACGRGGNASQDDVLRGDGGDRFSESRLKVDGGRCSPERGSSAERGSWESAATCMPVPLPKLASITFRVPSLHP